MNCAQVCPKGLNPSEAIAELWRVAGSQFDPDVVEAFCRSLEVNGLDDGGVAAVRERSSAASPIALERA